MKMKECTRGCPAFFPASVAVFAAAVLALTSCSSPVDVCLSDSETAQLPAACFLVELPISPAGLSAVSGAETGGFPVRVVLASDFGVCRELYLDWGERARLEFKKNQPAAVLAYLPTATRPYGAIYPYTSALDDRDGFAAEILWELYNEGGSFSEAERENVRLFNWHKLLDALREQEDPWLVDSEKIKEVVKSGKFSKSKIKNWVKKPSGTGATS
ncbi:MAG: hypothetical protein ILP18_10135 [Treponema sp.]|nr:hypothetical protein [Treponema sp.]